MDVPARWIFTAFDWARFEAIAPAVRAATEMEDSGQLADVEIADYLEGMDGPSEQVANLAIVHGCTADEAVTFDSGLPELIVWIRRRPAGEEAAELLGRLISAEPYVESWFACEQGLAGMLSVEETRQLGIGLARLRSAIQPTKPPRGLPGLARRFTPTDLTQARLEDLMSLIDEIVDKGQGLAMIVED